MTIYRATCFAAGQWTQLTYVNSVTNSNFKQRTGFAGNVIEFTGAQAQRAGLYIKDDMSSVTELYVAVRYEHKGDSSYNAQAFGLAYNTTGVFSVFRTGGSPRTLFVCRMDSGTATSLGSGTISINNGTQYIIEYYWKLGSTDGQVKVWVNGVLDIDLSNVNTQPSGITGVNICILGSCNESAFNCPNAYVGELILSDSPIHTPFTQSRRFAVLWPAGAGSNSGWSGSYDDVNDQVPNDDGGIITNETGAISTFTLTSLPSGVESVEGVNVWARILGQGAPTPRQVQPVVRTNGANYTGTEKPLTVRRPWYVSKFWSTNPATGQPWTKNEINNLEAGVKAVS